MPVVLDTPVPDAVATAPVRSHTETVAVEPPATESPTLPVGQVTARGVSAPIEMGGSFRSDSGAKLDLVVDWDLTAEAGADTARLTVSVSLSSYSLQVSARPNLCKLTVGETTETFSTPAITIDENKLTLTPLHTAAFDIPLTGVPTTFTIRAEFPFNGTYGGKTVGRLTAVGTLTVG